MFFANFSPLSPGDNIMVALRDLTALDGETLVFYGDVLDILLKHEVPFLVGGAFALNCYADITRDTKDLDLFVRPGDCGPVLRLLERSGYRTELTFPHWLGKAYHGDRIIDIIFNSGNGQCEVDDDWFRFAVEATALGRPVKLCAVEEMIWTKSFVMQRERFDGADINHLIRSRGASLDWQRLLARYGEHWRLLLAHLVLFGYVYPRELAIVPGSVMRTLGERLQRERASEQARSKVCRGTLLSRAQYLTDVREWGYQDARLPPHGKMNPQHLAVWTDCIGVDNPSLEDQ
jgi:hypothetical protein